MIIGFAIVTLSKRNIISPYFSASYNVQHLLILVAIVFLIFFGAYNNDIVYMLEQSSKQSDVIYAGYGIIALSHTIFSIIMLKGTRVTKIQKGIRL